jgi:hypothetical protein
MREIKAGSLIMIKTKHDNFLIFTISTRPWYRFYCFRTRLFDQYYGSPLQKWLNLGWQIEIIP